MPAHGSAYMEATLTGRWALSLLTEGWTDEEVAALEAGDEEAREALSVELYSRLVRQPDGCDINVLQIHSTPPEKRGGTALEAVATRQEERSDG